MEAKDDQKGKGQVLHLELERVNDLLTKDACEVLLKALCRNEFARYVFGCMNFRCANESTWFDWYNLENDGDFSARVVHEGFDIVANKLWTRKMIGKEEDDEIRCKLSFLIRSAKKVSFDPQSLFSMDSLVDKGLETLKKFKYLKITNQSPQSGDFDVCKILSILPQFDSLQRLFLHYFFPNECERFMDAIHQCRNLYSLQIITEFTPELVLLIAKTLETSAIKNLSLMQEGTMQHDLQGIGAVDALPLFKMLEINTRITLFNALGFIVKKECFECLVNVSPSLSHLSISTVHMDSCVDEYCQFLRLTSVNTLDVFTPEDPNRVNVYVHNESLRSKYENAWERNFTVKKGCAPGLNSAILHRNDFEIQIWGVCDYLQTLYLALYPLMIPCYVFVEIFDWLPTERQIYGVAWNPIMYRLWTQKEKVAKIQNMRKSIETTLIGLLSSLEGQ